MIKFAISLFIYIGSVGLMAQEIPEEESPLTVVSGEAEYNGKDISLSGDVLVKHELGTISAHQFTISPGDNSAGQFSKLTMSDDVRIHLQNGGSLSCQRAEVDYDQLRGTFRGDGETPEVVYVYHDQTNTELVIKGLQMQADFILLAEKDKKCALNVIQIDDRVEINFKDEYRITGDRALYQRDLANPNLMAGILTTSIKNTPYCLTTNKAGDRIEASAIALDTQKKELLFSNPNGRLVAQNTSFSAEQLIWTDSTQSLTLSGQVEVDHNSLMTLKTPQQLTINQGMVGGKKEIVKVSCPQETKIVYFDRKKEIVHKIDCYGLFEIDHLKAEARFHSPRNNEGQVIEERQVYLEDMLGEMSADDVQIVYQKNGKQMEPSKVVLDGHVKIFNRFNGHTQESSSVLQYALADHVEYDPSRQELILTSSRGNRVLFFDKINSVQMSAPTLKVIFDKETHKEKVQGSGDVRFTFIEKEFDQLKQRFRISR